MPQLDVVLTDVCKTFPGGINAVIDFSAEIDDGVDAARKGLADVGQNDVELWHNDVTVVGRLIQSFGGSKHQAPDRLKRYLIDHATLVEITQ